MTDFLKLSQEAFEASTAFVDANYRADWEYSIKAFRNEHAPGSKYLSPEYAARSRIFRPKSRAIIRKNEAAGAVALFSNMEVVDLQPGNPDDEMSVAGRDLQKALLEYRLGVTLPAFEICMGGIQDAQTQGAVVSYQYWEYKMRNGRKVKDQPCIELRPIENIRLDGGASWIDPIGTSPYFCDIIPMYVCDVRAMMKNADQKTGKPKWKPHEDAVIMRARPDAMDTTRKARMGKQQDPHDETTGIKSYDIVWVMRWFMLDSQGEDQTFYTLGTEELLTDAQPIEEVYFHGKRPYEMGYAVLETHKVMKTSMPMLTKPLQQETNEVANQRLDNVKFVLNKRWLVARGRQADVQSLVRNVPGGVTLTTDPNTDIKESNWPDVTSSAYVEQDRLNADFDELAGNFSPSTKVANNAVNDTLGGSRMAAQGAGMMTDYLLRTIIETWWEKVLRQLLLLEKYYETDEVVLSICGKKARLFPRFGTSQMMDDLLLRETDLRVNVGMGASNPDQRFQKLLTGTNAVMDVVAKAPPGFNVGEFIKESYANMGFRDGTRFWSEKQDPRLLKAMQIIQQLQGELTGKRGELAAQGQLKQLEIASNERVKGAEIQVNNARIEGDLAIRRAELVLESQRIELERLKLQIDAMGKEHEGAFKSLELDTKREESALKLEGERQKLKAQAVKIAGEIEKTAMELQAARQEGMNEEANTQSTDKLVSAVSEISKHMESMKSMIDSMKAEREKPRGPRRARVKSGDGEVFELEVD